MLRVWSITAAMAVLTATLGPMQWLAIRLGPRPARWIPVVYHRLALRLVDVRMVTQGKPLSGHPVLIVANHISWLDIVVVGAQMPLSFVAKAEVAGWPLFGTLARLQRTVFVDRTRRHEVGQQASDIGKRLAAGDPMVLFAEGTTSDGNRVLPFRSALIGAAREALTEPAVEAVWVQPLSIAYTHVHGLPMGRSHRPLAAWAGDIDLVPHLKEVLRRGAIDVTVTWGEPMPYRPGTDRKALTRAVEGQVRRLSAAARQG
jgi:1-acyl-sn-glycerol-3-phosphate acyltransferase